MRSTIHFLAVGLLMLPVGAQEGTLEGRAIVLTTGEHVGEHVPIALPFEGAPPAKGLTVQEPATGRSFPVTIRNGELVFVSEGLTPNTQHQYVIAARDGDAPPVVTVKKVEDADALEVLIGEEHFTTFHYSKENKKPFLWPVYAEGGVAVTRDWPMGPKVITEDHPHQKSCWTAYGDVNGADCWTEGSRSGFQVVEQVDSGSGDAYGWIASRNTWLNNARQPVVTEEREYRFYATPAKARIFDVAVTFTANHGDALFKDTKEGGLIAVRMRDELTEKFGQGVITNAAGGVGMAQCWGKPSPWCDYTGSLDGFGLRGVALFDHPSNLRYPTHWHVRDYGLMGANCFGYSDFTRGDPEPRNGDYTLKSGEKMTFRYRVYVHSGNVEDARVADRYADFATPPQARLGP